MEPTPLRQYFREGISNVWFCLTARQWRMAWGIVAALTALTWARARLRIGSAVSRLASRILGE